MQQCICIEFQKWMGGGVGEGGSGILESSNPGSGRYEEKKTSFIFLSRGRSAAVSDRESARQTRTFAAVYFVVTPATSLWMKNLTNSKVVDIFSRFLCAPGPKPFVWFNWFKRDSVFPSLLLQKQTRRTREIWLSGLFWFTSAWDIFFGDRLLWSNALQP